MTESLIGRAVRYAVLAVALASLSFTLAGCGGRLDGTYTDDSGFMKYTFTGGKVQIQMPFGASTEMPYTVKNKKLMIKAPDGTVQEFPMDEQGCFQIPLAGRMCKVKS